MHNYLTAHISASAIRANVAAIRSRLAPGVKLCAVVKCNSYGHGQDLLLGLLGGLTDWLAVATPAEALHLRDRGYDGPVLVFFSSAVPNGELHPGDTLDELLRQGVTLTIAAAHEVDLLGAATKRTDTDAKVHVMVDTGMTRSGLLSDEAPGLVERIRLHPYMRLTGIYTHLAAADEADKTAAREQLQRFDEVLARCRATEGIIRHAANSAAIADLPEAHYDMVRPGIAVYGCQPGDELANPLPLRPSLRLTGHVMQIKTVPAGTRCGYGLTYEFPRASRVGLVPVGYGDGYLQSLSGRGATMCIRDSQVPICGRVSMDQTVIDLTDVPAAAVGDEVEILSPDPAAPNSVENLARIAGTIPYELLCRLGRRVQRTLIE